MKGSKMYSRKLRNANKYYTKFLLHLPFQL